MAIQELTVLDLPDLDEEVTCTAARKSRSGLCGRPAVAIVTAGCGCNHTTFGPVCRGDLELLRRDRVDCAACWRGTVQHSCRRRVLREESL